MRAGVPRNFQILSPLDFLAELTQHIPPKGSHLIRYYGWYSNKSRGMRKKGEAAVSDEPSSEETTTSRSSQAWAMLIKRVYEVDPEGYLRLPHAEQDSDPATREFSDCRMMLHPSIA